MKAYILIEVDPGASLRGIVNGGAMSSGLASYKGVVSADVVHGEYDLVVIVEGDPVDIDRTLLKIRGLPYIKKTVSLLTFVFE
jgi:hypothetical protein